MPLARRRERTWRRGTTRRAAGAAGWGRVLSARHRRVAKKFYNNQAEALHEWRMVQCLMALAPQCTASPASISMGSGQQAHNSGLYYILTTQYAGDMLVTRLDERRLDADEFRLCLLQAIHFALLLGNTSVLVHDIHPINICVRNAGSQIEVRWIDFVTWKKEPRNEPYYSDILCQNATLLLQQNAWSTSGHCGDEWTERFINGHLRRISGYGAQASVISPDFSLELTGFFSGKHLIHFLVLKMKDFRNFVLDFDAEQVYLKLQVTNLKNKEVTVNPKPQTLEKIGLSKTL